MNHLPDNDLENIPWYEIYRIFLNQKIGHFFGALFLFRGGRQRQPVMGGLGVDRRVRRWCEPRRRSEAGLARKIRPPL